MLSIGGIKRTQRGDKVSNSGDATGGWRPGGNGGAFPPPMSPGVAPSNSVPPKRSWWRTRVPVWALGVAAVAGLGTGLVLQGGGGDGDDSAAQISNDTAQSERSTTAVDEPDTTAGTTAPRRTTTTEAATTTTTEPEPEEGTRENPFALSDPLKSTDGIEIVLKSVNWDGWGAIQAENQFNDPPPAGQRYVLVNATITNSTDEPITPWIAIEIGAIGSQQRVHERCSAVLPESLSDAPELYPGGTATGNVCVLVSEAEVSDGSLLLMVSTRFGEPVFVDPN